MYFWNLRHFARAFLLNHDGEFSYKHNVSLFIYLRTLIVQNTLLVEQITLSNHYFANVVIWPNIGEKANNTHTKTNNTHDTHGDNIKA